MARQTPRDARHLTLGMDGAWDAFRKLEWEVTTYLTLSKQKLPAGEETARELRFPMYAAMNAAGTAWSLVEWLWFEVEHAPETRQMLTAILPVEPNGTLPQLKAAARSVPEINACNQIAHGTKHAQLTDMTDGLSAPVYYDVWLIDGSIVMNSNGKVSSRDEATRVDLPVEELLVRVTEWWRGVLVKLDIPDRTNLVPGTRSVR